VTKTLSFRGALAALCIGLTSLAACDDPSGPDRAASIEITAGTRFLVPGDTVALSVAVSDARGRPLSRVEIGWSTDNPAVATVAAGVVTAVAPGTALITASAGGAQDTVRVVVETPLRVITIYPSSRMLALGNSTRLVPHTLDDRAFSVPLTTHTARYSSSDSSVVTVSDSGVVRAASPGTAVVTVRAGGKALEVPVSVVRPYTLTALGTLGGKGSRANAINQSGQVVGSALTEDGSTRAFLWEGGRMRDLGSLGHPYAEAVAINDAGVVVGNAGTGPTPSCTSAGCTPTEPWRWEGGTMTRLDVAVPEGSAALLTDVNNRGEITGYSYREHMVRLSVTAGRSGFVWRNGALNWINSTGGREPQPGTPAVAINDEGAVAVTLSLFPAGHRAHLWKNGQLTPVESDPGKSIYTAAADVNRKGQIAGSHYNSFFGFRIGGFVWGGDTLRTADLAPGIFSPVIVEGGINNLGHSVGTSRSPAGESFGFLWKDGLVALLDDLLVGSEWTVQGATSINVRGQIVGYGKNRSTGAVSALLLTPPQ
jgi:probable HAF family extracellular repeat protein